MDCAGLHPINLSSHQVRQWLDDAATNGLPSSGLNTLVVATSLCESAIDWAASQELQACCKLLRESGHAQIAEQLESSRRYRPRSLKSRAIDILESAPGGKDPYVAKLTARDVVVLQRALEALPGD